MRALALALALAASPAFAQDKPVLKIATYESFTADWGPGPKVEEAFEKTCECDLQFVSLTDGVGILNRLKLEGDGTEIDLVLGLDQNLIADAEATGRIAKHGIDASAVDVPGGFESETFVPYDYAHFAVIYDTQTVPNPPKSLKELVEGTGGQIVLQDPRSSTPGLGFLVWMRSVFGDDTEAAWEKLNRRVLTVTPGWSQAYGLFTSGEADMVLSYTTSPAYHMVAENSDRYQAVEFEEGHPLQIEVAGIVAGTDQPDLARDFLRFMISPAFQDIIPTTNWMKPAAATQAPLPDAFAKLIEPETITVSPDRVAANRDAWIDEWLSASR